MRSFCVNMSQVVYSDIANELKIYPVNETKEQEIDLVWMNIIISNYLKRKFQILLINIDIMFYDNVYMIIC